MKSIKSGRPGKFGLDRVRANIRQELENAQKNNRMNIIQAKRNAAETVLDKTSDIKHEKRADLLKQWKVNRKKDEENRRKQKPAFKVGIMQKKATGSPIIKLTTSYAKKNFLKPEQLLKVNKQFLIPNGVVTRAKAKAIGVKHESNIPHSTAFSMMVDNKLKPIKCHKFKAPKLSTNPLEELENPINNAKNEVQEGGAKHLIIDSSASQNLQFDVYVESNKNENESSAYHVNGNNKSKVPDEVMKMPIYYSPFVNKSRGNAYMPPRKEKHTLSIDELIENEEKVFQCRIYSFRKYIECETQRLLETCQVWEKIKSETPDLPEEVEEEILSVCGKTNLLTSDKFMQFKDLINKCESGDPMVKAEDLQGYQDWVSIEVEKLDLTFVKLEESKANGWKIEIAKSMNAMALKDKKPGKPKKVAAPRSNIREHILAARKLRQNGGDLSSFQKLETWVEAKSTSPVKTPRKPSNLLKDVLNSETKKLTPKLSPVLGCSSGSDSRNNLSGLHIVTATQLAKRLTPSKAHSVNALEDGAKVCNEETPAIDVLENITGTKNIVLTPLKSILKQSPVSVSTGKHSVKFRLTKSNGKRKQQRLNGKCSEPLISNGDMFASPIVRKPLLEIDINAEKKGLHAKYFQPLINNGAECSDLSNEVGDSSLISAIHSVKIQSLHTPTRRSARLANRLASNK